VATMEHCWVPRHVERVAAASPWRRCCLQCIVTIPLGGVSAEVKLGEAVAGAALSGCGGMLVTGSRRPFCDSSLGSSGFRHNG